MDCLQIKWSPEQTAEEVRVSHETIYRHIYADKAAGGSLWKKMRCQKKRKKRYAIGQEHRGQIVARRPSSKLPAYIEERVQVGHWEVDAIIGANHKQAIVTLVYGKLNIVVTLKNLALPNSQSLLIERSTIFPYILLASFKSFSSLLIKATFTPHSLFIRLIEV